MNIKPEDIVQLRIPFKLIGGSQDGFEGRLCVFTDGHIIPVLMSATTVLFDGEELEFDMKDVENFCKAKP